MFKHRIAWVVGISLVLGSLLAAGAHVGAWGGSGVAMGASAPPALRAQIADHQSLESPPPMYLGGLGAGCWSSGPVQRYAVARAGIDDGAGEPVLGALVEVEFDIQCLRNGADSGSAYTEPVEENGIVYAVATVKGSMTFKPPKSGCVIIAEVVRVTHPDYTWDPDGGVSPSLATLCR